MSAAAAKLYLDEHLSDRLAEALGRAGVEAVTVRQAETRGMTDDLQLEYAAKRGFNLVTCNQVDFLALAEQWLAAGRPFPTIVLLSQSVPQGDIRHQVRALRAVLPMIERNPESTIVWAT